MVKHMRTLKRAFIQHGEFLFAIIVLLNHVINFQGMKKLAVVLLFMAMNMPLFAQLGYWYKSNFIELSEKNDSVYYLCFKDKSTRNKQLMSEKNVTLGSGYFVTVTDYPDPNVTFL